VVGQWCLAKSESLARILVVGRKEWAVGSERLLIAGFRFCEICGKYSVKYAGKKFLVIPS
jgi:hypothetical protein